MKTKIILAALLALAFAGNGVQYYASRHQPKPAAPDSSIPWARFDLLAHNEARYIEGTAHTIQGFCGGQPMCKLEVLELQEWEHHWDELSHSKSAAKYTFDTLEKTYSMTEEEFLKWADKNLRQKGALT